MKVKYQNWTSLDRFSVVQMVGESEEREEEEKEHDDYEALKANS